MRAAFRGLSRWVSAYLGSWDRWVWEPLEPLVWGDPACLGQECLGSLGLVRSASEHQLAQEDQVAWAHRELLEHRGYLEHRESLEHLEHRGYLEHPGCLERQVRWAHQARWELQGLPSLTPAHLVYLACWPPVCRLALASVGIFERNQGENQGRDAGISSASRQL